MEITGNIRFFGKYYLTEEFVRNSNTSVNDLCFTMRVSHVSRPLHTPFVISRGAKTHAECVVIEVEYLGYRGIGEAVPYARYGETVETTIAELENLNQNDPFDFIKMPLKAGAARNALDCAFWDLRAKIAMRPVWELANLPAPKTLRCTQTLSLAEPKIMAERAKLMGASPLIKIKLGGLNDIECVQAVRQSSPNASIIVDANEGWNVEQYHSIIPALIDAKVEMIEQPFHAEMSDALAGLDRPIAICADESVHTSDDISKLKAFYDMVNIKLDKTGGLSEALKLKNAAIESGMSYMVGCMVGSSLSMAPAMLLGNDAKYVDLDGPIFLTNDVENGIIFHEGEMSPFTSALWG